MIHVGWYTYFAPRRLTDWRVKHHPSAVIRMRYLNVATWINRHCPDIQNSLYDPEQQYDVVVFLKMMGQNAQAAHKRAKAYGAKTVFDFNVNFVEEWGVFPIERTRPEQYHKDQASWMLAHADHVVADSTILGEIARRQRDDVTVITDNVNLRHFHRRKQHQPGDSLTLVWSGIAQKGYHLRALFDVLPQTPGIRLLLISDRPPPIMADLAPLAPLTYRQFSPGRFPRDLLGGDVVISPRAVCNSYTIGHTEYKITTGMAVGLPAIASRQQSYVEAINDRGGGFLADTPEEWIAAINALRDVGERARIGALARQTVEARYNTSVVAARYAELICKLANG